MASELKVQCTAVKLIYFSAFSAFAALLSFFYVYLKEVPHLTGFEIGTIAAVQQFNTIVFVPLWGIFADKFGRRRMLLIAIFFSSALILVLWMQNSFWLIMLIIVLFTFFYNPLTTLLDSIALDFVEQYNTSSYGELRLWASVGWAMGAFLTGHFVGADSLHLIFPISFSILIITWLILKFIYKPLKLQRGIGKVSYADIFTILKQKPALFRFLMLLFVYTICTAPIQLFINLYFNEIGATTAQIGIAYAVQALSELPFFFYGKRVVIRFGAKPVLIFTMIITVFRMLGYGIFSEPWVAIGIGALQGICLALFFVAMVEYVQGSVAKEHRSTGQSMIYTFFGAGMCLGNLFAGYMKDAITIQKTMLLNSVLIALLIIFLITQKSIQNRRG